MIRLPAIRGWYSRLGERKLGLAEARERPGCDPPVGDSRLIFWAYLEAMARRDLVRPRLGQKKPSEAKSSQMEPSVAK